MDPFDNEVMYLSADDFVGTAIKPYVVKDKPLFVLLQSSTCPHCHSARPAFLRLQRENRLVNVASIMADGTTPGEMRLRGRIGDIFPGQLRGFPSYMLIKRDGHAIPYDGDRTFEDMTSFIRTHVS